MIRDFFFKAPDNYDVDEASVFAGLSCPADESVTQQQFAAECDINEIVRRFGLTGEVPDDVRMPVSGDFTSIVDFQTAMQSVVAAQAEFMRLPAELRYRFANDPQRLMEFLADDRNRDEAIKLGLVEKPKEVPRDVVKAIDELSAKLTAKPS